MEHPLHPYSTRVYATGRWVSKSSSNSPALVRASRVKRLRFSGGSPAKCPMPLRTTAVMWLVFRAAEPRRDTRSTLAQRKGMASGASIQGGMASWQRATQAGRTRPGLVRHVATRRCCLPCESTFLITQGETGERLCSSAMRVHGYGRNSLYWSSVGPVAKGQQRQLYRRR